MTQISTEKPAKNDAWLIYDGDCPVCKTYCKYIRLSATVGQLHLVDARQPSDLLDEVTQLGLDIDQGMAFKCNQGIYYGADAIHILTLLSSPIGIFNRVNYAIFSTNIGAKIFYPMGKAVRVYILKLLGIQPINNLKIPPSNAIKTSSSNTIKTSPNDKK